MTATPQSNHLPWWQRIFAGLAATRFGTWMIREVATRVDPPLLRATGGRVSFGGLPRFTGNNPVRFVPGLAGLVGIQVALLTTTGAKSEQPRTVPLLYFEDAGRVVIIGSNVGMTFHPGWVHNLRANPEAIVTIGGRGRAVIVQEVESPERERLWAAAERIYAGFRQYEQRAGSRHIPVFVLNPDQG